MNKTNARQFSVRLFQVNMNWANILFRAAVVAALAFILPNPARAQTLLVRMPLTDTGAGTTCASDTSTGGANVTLNMLNMSGGAADFHGTPGGGVSGLNVALDFSTNADFSVAGGINVEGNGNGPIADNTSSAALNFGSVTASTGSIWFKANSIMNNSGNFGPRIFVIGKSTTADKAAANSIGLYWQGANEIAATIGTTEVNGPVNAGNFTVGQWYFYAVTYDGTTATIYEGIDGSAGVTAVASQAVSTTIALSGGSVLMIGNRTAQTRPFDGWLDDFRFYSGAASANFVEDIRWSALAPIVGATAGNGEVTLNWPNLAGAASYTVYRSTSATGPFNTSPTGGTGLTSATFTDSSVANGTTYYYEVTAVDNNGDGTTSQYSQPVAATPEAAPTTPQFTSATGGNEDVVLHWTTSTGALPITYNLARSTVSGGEVFIANTSATSYTDTPLANGTPYYYTVTAVYSTGEASATSSETSVTPVGPPAAPATVYADGVAGGGVLVSWTTVPAATFNIWRSTTGPSGTYTEIATAQTGTNYLDAGGVLGDYYEVVADGPGGLSPNSSPAAAVPMLLNVNFDSAASGNNYGAGSDPAPSAMSGAAAIGSSGDIWNGVNDGGVDGTFTAGPLVNADGSSSPVTLSLLAPSGSFDDNAPGFGSFTPFSWVSVADMNADIGYPNSPYAALMATLIAANSAAENGYVQLGGLAPNAAYTLYVYSAGNAAGRTSTFWVDQGTAATPGTQQGATQSCTYDDATITLVNGVDYLVFNPVADSSGNLLINFGNLGANENDMCGFQLAEGNVLGSTITTSANINNLTLCTNTSVTFTAASGSINGVPDTTIVSFSNVITTSVLGSAVTTSTTNVYTANGSFSGTAVAGLSSTTATLTLPLSKNLKYRVAVTALPASGAPLLSSITFDTFAPTLVIETSDFNFSSGSWYDTSANGGVWADYNVAGTPGVDFYKSGGEGPNALFYRDFFTGAPYITEAFADTFSEQKDAVASTGATNGVNDFPELAIGYDTAGAVGVETGGDWQNYTRTFGPGPYLAGTNVVAGGSGDDSAPAGTYNVWLYMSISGGGEDAILSSVTPSPATTTSQTVNPLGQFGTASFAENDWNGFEYVPMTDKFGNLLAVNIGGGEKTFQLQVGPSGGPNLGFFMLMPATTPLTPFFTYLYPDGTQPFEPTNVFTFKVGTSNGVISSSGIGLTLNGIPVTPTLSQANGIWTGQYPIQYNTNYAAVVSATNSAGQFTTITINFDTFFVNSYQWEAVDYDFSTNNGNFSGPPPIQGGELVGGWISGQFIDNPVPTADTTSTTATGPLGEAEANSYYDYPANINPGVDFGAGAIAQQGVDINCAAAGQGAGQALYRVQDGVGNQVATDYLRPKFKAAQLALSDPNIGPYNVGYIAEGDWFNYTRHYPAGTYYVWGRLAFDAPYSAIMGEVTSGAGTANQTVTPLGTFTGNNGAGYQAWQWIPLLDANNNPVAVTLGGQAATLQVQSTAAGINLEFFMLVPQFTLTPSYVGGQFQISFPTEPGLNYQVQYKSSLTAPSWSPVGLPIAGDGTVHTVIESSPGFYRVVAAP
jgi:fibronectin type 3 domain-containing protein